MNARLLSLGAGAACFVIFLTTARAQVPQIINYQGRVLVGSTNFNGTGQFKFALVNTNGSATFWSNDNTSTAGSEPTAAVSLTVSNGLYSVLLGDTAIANMTNAIPPSVFNNSDVRLRVWFNDGTHGSQLLTPDQRIAAVGYAITATSASSVPGSGITGTVPVSSGGTGAATASSALTNLGAAATSGNLSQFAPTTSSQLAGVISDETGTGSLVLANGPSLFNPFIGSGMFVSPFVFVESNDAATNNTTDILVLRHTVTGPAANGIGAGIRIDLQNSSGLVPTAAEISGLFTNATAGSEVAQLKFSTLSGGNLVSRLTLDNTAATFGMSVLAPVGTAAVPGYSFAGDTNTGMFRSAADTLDFATGGVSRMTLSASTLDVAGGITAGTGNVQLVDGTGKITGLNATTLADLSGTNLTNLSATNLGVGTLPDGRLGGSYTQAVSLTNAANSFTGNGAGLTNLNETDGVIGNEVTNATNATLTRSGTGMAGSPFMLALNTANANTWSALQTFGAVTAVGTANINATGTASTNIGNSTGAIAVSGTETHNGVLNANAGVRFGSTGDTMTFFKNVTAALDFPNTVGGACTDLTVTVPGAQSGDGVLLALGNFPCNGFFTARVSTTDTVIVRFNNPNAASIDPISATFHIIVIR